MAKFEASVQPTILFEGATNTAQGWQSLLCIDNAQLSSLVTSAILRTQSLNWFRLNFVGLLSFHKTAFFVVPKIFEDSENVVASAIRRAFGCIEAYERRHHVPDHSEIGDYQPPINSGKSLAQTFKSLLDFTVHSGFHTKGNIRRSDDLAHINWPQTVGNSLAAHSKNSLFYVNPVGFVARNVISEIAYIQAEAMLDLKTRLGPLRV